MKSRSPRFFLSSIAAAASLCAAAQLPDAFDAATVASIGC